MEEDELEFQYPDLPEPQPEHMPEPPGPEMPETYRFEDWALI